jgi:hypothetical protein
MLKSTWGSFAICIALFGACSFSTDGGGAGEDVVSVQAPLTASTTLQQALSGKIVPAAGGPGGLISASIAGEPTVGDDGSASYRIPIWVPDGLNGLQPDLAIEYNSEAGMGLLGPRWHLKGLSVIKRCHKTRAQDGVQTTVNFSDNVFCLDGQRLIHVSTTAANMEFRTEKESYRKILAAYDSVGVFRFKVYERDGRILHYGRTNLSRLHANLGAADDVNYAYYLDKIEDRYGNSIIIECAGAVPGPANVSDVDELAPSKVSWGGQRRCWRGPVRDVRVRGSATRMVRLALRAWVGYRPRAHAERCCDLGSGWERCDRAAQALRLRIFVEPRDADGSATHDGRRSPRLHLRV